MKINIADVIVKEFDKIDFRKLNCYGAYLVLQKRLEEIENKFPQLKDDINEYNDLFVYYELLHFEDFANFAIEFLKCLHI